MNGDIAPSSDGSPEFHYRMIPTFTAHLFSFSEVGDGVRVGSTLKKYVHCPIQQWHRFNRGRRAPIERCKESGTESTNRGTFVYSADVNDQYLSEGRSESDDDNAEDIEVEPEAGPETVSFPSCNPTPASPLKVLGVVTRVRITTSADFRRRPLTWKRGNNQLFPRPYYITDMHLRANRQNVILHRMPIVRF